MTLTLAPEAEAHLQALADRRNETPEAVVDAAIKRLLREEPPQEAPAEEVGDAERRRMRDLLASVQAQARLLPPLPPERRATGPLFALVDVQGQPEQYARCQALMPSLAVPLVTTWP